MRKCSVCKIEKELSEFHKKGEGHSYMCKECRKEYIRVHYKKNKASYIDKASKKSKSDREWFGELKSKLKCEVCGESHIACLDFHHNDPSEKDNTVAKLVSHSRKKVLEEIKKCRVLCANCHRKLHFLIKQSPVAPM